MFDVPFFEFELDNVARLTFGLAFDDVAAGLDGGHNGSVGGRAADAEFFEFFDE